MFALFISHTAADEAETLRLLSWLRESGRQDVFVDLDIETGLRAGERWQSKLLDSIGECEAILCLLSEQWIASKWCWAEYVVGKKLGKRCIPLVVKPLDWDKIPVEIQAEHQIVDLVSDSDGWVKLESALHAAGIEATGFALAPGAAPYPGFPALTENEAALFFGRDAEILAALDALRRIAERPEAHLFAIIGPSGAGKSSFLRAGLLPRLLRDHNNFLPLPTLKPSGGILEGPAGLWSSLQQALARPTVAARLPATIPRSMGAIKARVAQDRSALSEIVGALLEAASRHAGISQEMRPTLVLPIDQGEELFDPEHYAQTVRLVEAIGSELLGRVQIITIATARTDAYGLFQADVHFAGFHHRPFNLAPLPTHRLPSVIEGPAAQVGLTIEPALIDALVKDASGADALPIVAFTLERLYRDFGVEGRLTLANYQSTQGTTGAIEAAFQAAFAVAPQRNLPSKREPLEQIVRRLFIPHLVRVDESGGFARRSMNSAELTPELRAMAELLVENRLLVANQAPQDDGVRIEIAHEALLRSWQRLATWLNEERAFLLWREQIGRARLSAEQGQRDWLSGRELAIAAEWKASRAKAIAQPELNFIDASEQRQSAANARAQSVRRLVTGSAIAAAAILAIFAAVAVWQATDAVKARQTADSARAVAERQSRSARARELALRASAIFENSAGETGLAGLLAAESLHVAHTLEAQQVAAEILALSPRDSSAIPTLSHWSKLRPSPDGRIFLNWTHDAGLVEENKPAAGAVTLLDPETFTARLNLNYPAWMSPSLSPGATWLAISGRGRQLDVVELETLQVVRRVDYETSVAARFDRSGRWLYVADSQGVIERRAAPDWQVEARLAYPVGPRRPPRIEMSVHPSGEAVLVSTNPGAMIVPTDGKPVTVLRSAKRGIWGASYDATGKRVLTLEGDFVARLRDGYSGQVTAELGHENSLSTAIFSDDGLRIATATDAGDVKIWNATTAKLQLQLRHERTVNTIAFSPDGTLLAAGDDDGVVRLWNTATGQPSHEWLENDQIWSLAFTNNGRALVTGAASGQLRRYDMATKAATLETRLPGGIARLAVDSDSAALALGNAVTRHPQSWVDMRATDRTTGIELWSKTHNGDFNSLVFSPDGGLFATTTGGGGRLKFWDTMTGVLRAESQAKGYSRALAFSADGSRLVAAADSASIVDARDGRVLATVGLPGNRSRMAIADNGKTLVTWTDDVLRVWQIDTAQQLARKTTRGRVAAAALHPQGNRVAYTTRTPQSAETGDTLAAISLWAVDSNATRRLAIAEQSNQIAFDRAGRRLAARIGKNRVAVWDSETLRPLLTASALPRNEVRRFSFSHDGERVLVDEKLVSSHKSAVRVWHIASGREIARIDKARDWRQLSGGSQLLLQQATEWRQFDLDSGDLRKTAWPDNYGVIRSLPGSDSVAGLNADGIKLIELASGTVRHVQRDEDAADITTFSVDQAGNRIVFAQRRADAGYRPGEVVLQDLETGTALARAAPDATLSSLSFADNGRSIAMLGTPGGVHTIGTGSHLFLWRWASDDLKLLSDDNPIGAMTTSPDQALLATAEGLPHRDNERSVVIGEPRVRIWDASNGTVLHTIARKQPLSDVRFSPDGRLLLARDAHNFTVYAVDGWQAVRHFRLEVGLSGGATAFAGNDWVVAPARQGVYLFAVDSERQHFLRHGSGFPAFRVSEDGDTIATLSRGYLNVWDVATGQPLARRAVGQSTAYTFVGPRSALYFTEDHLESDGSLLRLPWRSDDLIDDLCRRIGRGFTEDEVIQYFPDDTGSPRNCTPFPQ